MKLLRLTACVWCTLNTVVGGWAAENPATRQSPSTAESPVASREETRAFAHGLVVALIGDALGPEWFQLPGKDDSLWRVALQGPGSATAELTSANTVFSGGRGVGDTATTLAWDGSLKDGQAQITLEVSSDRGARIVRLHLSATLPTGWRVVRADWPILPSILVEPGLKMAAPFGWGLEYDVKPGMSYEGTYPSLVASMPFVAFYRGGKGLYVGMHDKQGNHKHLAVKAGEGSVGVTCTHWPSDADTAGGRYSPEFDVAVAAFDGDYWNAAQIYRAFNRGTPWGGPRGGLRLANQTRPVPGWLKDIDLWLMPSAEPLKNVDACRKAGEFFGVPIALHWYNWHEIPFDTLYPDYFPAKPNFREGVKALQDAGFRVMPYINGRLCDPNSKTWTQEGADKAAARQADGKPYAEVYGSKVPLNVMCPYTRFWQGKIGGIVDRLVHECGVDGVYIDQIGAAGAVRCFDPDHGHSPGGGTFWFDGYRKMLDQIRARLPKDRMITTEENAECWNDQFDALLMVNTPSTGGRRIIPLMPAVYGGRLITFGFQYMSGDDIPKVLPFRAKMARAFLWGAQLGWINVDMIMADNARREAQFLRNLARARSGAHEFLLTGRFLGEAEVTGDLPRLKGEGSAGSGKYSIDLPAVMATAWLAADGTLGLAVVNLSDEPRLVEVRPPWPRLKELHNGPDGQLRIGGRPISEEPKTVPVTLPPCDARVIRVKPATRPS
jgi:hypothetical protein